MTRLFRQVCVVAGLTLLIGVVAVKPLHAMGTDEPSAPSDDSGKKKKSKATDEHAQELAKAKFLQDYRAARELIVTGHYNDGIAAMHAIGHDEHPDVANYIGYAYRKLGDYDNSKT